MARNTLMVKHSKKMGFSLIEGRDKVAMDVHAHACIASFLRKDRT